MVARDVHGAVLLKANVSSLVFVAWLWLQISYWSRKRVVQSKRVLRLKTSFHKGHDDCISPHAWHYLFVYLKLNLCFDKDIRGHC